MEMGNIFKNKLLTLFPLSGSHFGNLLPFSLCLLHVLFSLNNGNPRKKQLKAMEGKKGGTQDSVVAKRRPIQVGY